MAEHPGQESSPPFSLFSIVTAYGVTTTLLYLLGFWSSFDINIMEFASFQDVLKLAVYPLLVSAATALAPILFQTLTRIEQVKSGDVTKVFWLIPAKWIEVIVLVCVTSIFPVWLFVSHEVWKWLLIGMLSLFALAFSFDDVSFLSVHVKNVVVRRFVVVTCLLVITHAFAWGKINAHRILDGTMGKIVHANIFKDEGHDAVTRKELLKGHDSLKYIGAAGDYFFFISMDNSKTFVVKYSDVYFLEFSKLPPK